MSKFVVVTGVSSGIGHGIAQTLIQRGYTVFGSVRKEADGQRMKAQLGESFVPLYFDVTDQQAISAAVRQVGDIVGGQGLAGLVNNAGISVSGPLMHLPIGEIRALFEVNVLGVIGVSQAFLPLLGAHDSAAHPPGRIVNISSVSGAIAVPFLGAYAGTKHALEALTQAFRRELSLYGIEVVAVEPGFVKTGMFEKNAAQAERARFSGTPYGDLWRAYLNAFVRAEKNAVSVNQVADAVYEALTSKKPKTRYPLDPIWWIGRVLSDRQFDRLIFRTLGFHKLLGKRPS